MFWHILVFSFPFSRLTSNKLHSTSCQNLERTVSISIYFQSIYSATWQDLLSNVRNISLLTNTGISKLHVVCLKFLQAAARYNNLQILWRISTFHLTLSMALFFLLSSRLWYALVFSTSAPREFLFHSLLSLPFRVVLPLPANFFLPNLSYSRISNEVNCMSPLFIKVMVLLKVVSENKIYIF